MGARLAFARVRGDWAFALVAGIAGPAVEAVVHATGAFHYTEPDFLGIPVWLPVLWANGGLAIRRLFGPRAPAAIGLTAPWSRGYGSREPGGDGR